MKTSFKEKLKKKDLLIGTILSLPSPEIAEIITNAGFDWIFVDAEHGTFDINGIQKILQVADDNCPCIVRAPGISKIWIKKLLDTGIQGIIFPLVNTEEEAREIVNLCKYPPDGTRSIGIGRAHKYGMKFNEYISSANKDISIILQIEHKEAVKNFESIISVPGIDGIFIGPYDLSGSLGKIGQVNDPEVQDNISFVKNTCDKAGMPVGIFGADAKAVKPFIKEGYTLITIGLDVMFLGKTLGSLIEEVKS